MSALADKLGACCGRPILTDLSSRAYQTQRYYCTNCRTHWNGRAAGHPLGESLRKFNAQEWERWVSAPVAEWSAET